MQAFAALLLALALAACTNSVGLKYAPGSGIAKFDAPIAPVAVGVFDDQRGEPANWLGAIRGGYGNPLKNLESDQPVASLVQAAFVAGLQARGVAVEPASAALQISGTVRQLDCNQYARQEANVEIDVAVTDKASGKRSFNRTYQASKLDGFTLATGVFASVEDLRVLTEKTLREAVDKALDDPALRAALQQ